MPFESLQALGEEKFKKITNSLIRGTACMALARTIQSEWGDFTNVAEKTLTQQLTRYKKALAEKNDVPKEEIRAEGKIDIKLLRGSDVATLAELVVYHVIQQKRVVAMFEKEQSMGGMKLPGLGEEITRGVEILESMQKIRFDLGKDEFAGTQPGFRGASERTFNPDGSVTDKAVFEAFSTAQRLLQNRGIAPALEGSV